MIAFRFNPRVCTKALYSNPGVCRCVRCRPDLHLPDPDAIGPASAVAARPLLPRAGGDIIETTPGAAGARAPDPAADRNPSLSDAPIGGPCLEEKG